jgi:hypothetical protein
MDKNTQRKRTEKKIESFIKRKDLHGLSDSKNIQWTVDLIKKYEGQLDWDVFSDNLSISWDFEIVNQFKHVINWKNLTKTLWGYVGFRKSSEFTTIKWINSFSEYIDWKTISEHCWDITPEIVIEFKDKWQWEKLINNNGVQWTKQAYEKSKLHIDLIDSETIKNSHMTKALNINIRYSAQRYL